MTNWLKVGAGLFALAAAGHIYARHIEVNWYAVRELELELLPAGSEPVRILHMSDAHLLPSQSKKRQFLRSLADLQPDLVVNTGDNIASAAAIPALATDIAPLLEVPGVLALGSNDKFAAGKRNIARYFLKDPRPKGWRTSTKVNPQLPVEDLVAKLTAGDWVNISNGRASFEIKGTVLDFVGVDDPHLEHDSFPVAGINNHDPAPPNPAIPHVKIGVAHAPYLRVLDQFKADSAQLIFAGHTHGGQLRLPFIGALVTNCDLPRQKAKGLHEHRGVPLHVSGGLGASPYYNMRTFNRPEVTVLTLTPKRATA